MTKIIFKALLNRLKHYILIFIGAGMFALFVWFRFIRVRQEKNIPFNLSTVGFLILLSVCILYLYLIYRSLFPKDSISIWVLLINFFYIPLEKFDYFWKHIYFIEKYYTNFMHWFTHKLDFYIIKYPIFYIIFYILPRTLLITILTLDIFYFNKLSLIYKLLFALLLLFLHRYIIYSIKMYKNDLIALLKADVNSISVPYVFGIHPSEWPENYDPDEDDDDMLIDVDMSLPIDIFIAYYVKQYIYENNIIEYCMYAYKEKFHNKQLIRFNVTEEALTFEMIGIYQKETKQRVEDILFLAFLEEHYNNFSNRNKIVKYIKIFIYLLYFLCWTYILIKSGSIENIENTEIIIIKVLEIIQNSHYEEIEDPFSGVKLH